MSCAAWWRIASTTPGEASGRHLARPARCRQHELDGHVLRERVDCQATREHVAEQLVRAVSGRTPDCSPARLTARCNLGATARRGS
jgi:hypothetical protein